jgi:F-type H+-transporting ATPase subunit a
MEESPLHPFELHNYIPIDLGGLDISINKAVVMMWVVVGLISILMIMAGSARRLVPGKLQSLAEMLVDFIRGIILDTIGKDGMKFFPLIATLFLFILFCNLLGLIPGSYTVTSQIIVTGVFAGTVYALSIALGCALHGMKFLGILVPPGTPGWMLPLMVPIEIISHLARPESLAVR